MAEAFNLDSTNWNSMQDVYTSLKTIFRNGARLMTLEKLNLLGLSYQTMVNYNEDTAKAMLKGLEVGCSWVQ